MSDRVIEFKEVWRRETENWEIVEYEKIPNALSCNVNYKHDDDIAFHFSCLGVSHEKLEEADGKLLDNLLTMFGNTALANGWNVSICSFWDNIPYCVPSLEDYGEDSDVAPEFLEMISGIDEFLGRGGN